VGKISKLPEIVAERIAAGEVIERPASVVKELVENALDAGSTSIQIRLEDGGKSLIEVLDDGCGMGVEDLTLSVERHATSKIKNFEDLEKLNTLGFRGEALPSVCAVADLTITTREANSDSAISIQVRAGVKSDPLRSQYGRFLGETHGTEIRVTSLFSHVPARLKFLKAKASEVSAIREWMERLSLSAPHVGFTLISDDKTLLRLKKQTLEERFLALLGEDFPVTELKREDLLFSPSLKVEAIWAKGLSFPHSKKIFQTVNSRSVRDRLLQQAIMQAFRQHLLPGQYPALFIQVTLEPQLVDVNAHPSKLELRFQRGQDIYQALQRLFEKILDRKDDRAMLQNFAQFNPQTSFHQPLAERPIERFDFSKSIPIQQSFVSNFQPEPIQVQSQTPAPEVPVVSPLSFSSRYRGSLFNTYLVFEEENELVLVDQHAAHERIRFEALKRQVTQDIQVEIQALLIPEVIHLDEEKIALIETHLPGLEKSGFQVEIFGSSAVVFRGVPAIWGAHDLKTRLRNLVERVLPVSTLSSSENLKFDHELFEAIASEACHSSIRGGDEIDQKEALELVKQLSKAEQPWNCPHGRPTIVKVPRLRFEEWFQRKL